MNILELKFLSLLNRAALGEELLSSAGLMFYLVNYCCVLNKGNLCELGVLCGSDVVSTFSFGKNHD